MESTFRPSYGLDEIAALRDLFSNLNRGLRLFRQYPSGHPILTQFKESFVQQLRGCLDNVGTVAVEVGFDSLGVPDEVIYRQPAGNDNIAHLLHRDGVRVLVIRPEVRPDEISRFLDLLVRCSQPVTPSEDIVNLLWQADLSHIEYEVVDSCVTGEVSDQVFDEERQCFSLPTRESAVDCPYSEQQYKEVGRPENRCHDTPQRVFQAFQHVVDFEPSERKTLEEMVRADRALDLPNEVVELLLQLCTVQNSAPDLRLTLESLQSTFDRLLAGARFDTACRIVEKIEEMLGAATLTSGRSRQRLQEFRQRCGDTVRIKLIAQVLNERPELPLADVESYLNLLGWESLNSLIWMLGELAHQPSRRMLCNLLVRKGHEKIDLLGAAVYDSRWYVVRNVAWVLGETAEPRVVAYLKKAAHHEDVRVRIETVRALRKIPSIDATQILIGMLNDSEQRVASAVTDALTGSGSADAFAALLAIVNKKAFMSSLAEKQRRILTALLACGKEAAVKRMAEFFGRNPLFGRAHLRRIQSLVISLLQKSELPEAGALLEDVARQQSGEIGMRAYRALQARRSTPQEVRG